MVQSSLERPNQRIKRGKLGAFTMRTHKDQIAGHLEGESAGPFVDIEPEEIEQLVDNVPVLRGAPSVPQF